MSNNVPDKYEVHRSTESAFLGFGTIHKTTVANTETGKSASAYGDDKNETLQRAIDKLKANE